jgi:hypothetical protein
MTGGMQFKVPKNTDKYEWTKHSLMKMQHYGLTAQRVLRVINNPQRKEEGVVKKTVAVMQPTSISTKDGKRVWSSEIWAMYQIKRKNKKKEVGVALGGIFKKEPVKIISAWRYPGISPKNNPIPEDIIREIENLA